MKEDENPQYYNIAHENAVKAGYTLTLSFLKFYQKDIFSQELKLNLLPTHSSKSLISSNKGPFTNDVATLNNQR